MLKKYLLKREKFNHLFRLIFQLVTKRFFLKILNKNLQSQQTVATNRSKFKYKKMIRANNV